MLFSRSMIFAEMPCNDAILFLVLKLERDVCYVICKQLVSCSMLVCSSAAASLILKI